MQQAEVGQAHEEIRVHPRCQSRRRLMSFRNFDECDPEELCSAGRHDELGGLRLGQKETQLAEKTETIEQTNNSLREAESPVLIEVGTRSATSNRAAQALVVAQLRQETARENMRVSVNKYKLVAALLSDVLQTQATLADADYEYQKALLAFWTAKAEYEKSIGADK